MGGKGSGPFSQFDHLLEIDGKAASVQFCVLASDRETVAAVPEHTELHADMPSWAVSPQSRMVQSVGPAKSSHWPTPAIGPLSRDITGIASSCVATTIKIRMDLAAKPGMVEL